MIRKVMLAAVTAVGLMTVGLGSAEAGCHRGGYGGYGGYGYGPRYGGYYGGPGYGFGGGVVVAPRVVTVPPPVYPVYPSYGYSYGAPYGYGGYGAYGPYGQAFGLQTGNFSMFLGR